MPDTNELLEEVIRTRRVALAGYAALLTMDRGAAEDLLQEALVRTFSRDRALPDVASAEAYVRTAIRSVFVDGLRRRPAPTAPAVAWPVAVGEDEVVSSDDGPWWVVVVTSGPPDTSEDDPQQAELLGLGYEPTRTPLDCLVGPAGEAIFPLDPSSETWATWGLLLYFRTAADADTFVDAWGRPVERVVEGSLACGWG